MEIDEEWARRRAANKKLVESIPDEVVMAALQKAKEARAKAELEAEAEENARRDAVNAELIKDIPESTMRAVLQRAKELREKHQKDEEEKK